MEEMARQLLQPSPVPTGKLPVWEAFSGSWNEAEEEEGEEKAEGADEDLWWSSKYSACPGERIGL